MKKYIIRKTMLNNQITKIENIYGGVKELYLGNNSITKIENIPDSVKILYLSCNPCYKIIKYLSIDEIIWINNFNKIISILKDYLIVDIIGIIQKYSIYECFV